MKDTLGRSNEWRSTESSDYEREDETICKWRYEPYSERRLFAACCVDLECIPDRDCRLEHHFHSTTRVQTLARDGSAEVEV